MTYRTHLAMAGALATVLLAATPGAAGAYTWTVEKGHVLACAGEEVGVRVDIELYENSAFGTHAQVSAQTAKAEYLRGGETDSGLFNNGTISRRLVVESQGEATESSQTVLINGSYAPGGTRQWVREVYDEPWGQVVSKGWKRPLSAAVTVNALGQRVHLTCETAFAYDLKVRCPADSGN